MPCYTMKVVPYFPVLILLTNLSLNRCDQQDLPAFPWSFPPAVTKGVKVSLGMQHKHRDWWQKCFHLCILVLLWQAIQQGRERWKNLLNHTWTSSRRKKKRGGGGHLWPATTKYRGNHNWSQVCMGHLVGNFIKHVVFLQPSPSADCLPMEMLNGQTSTSMENEKDVNIMLTVW